MISFPNAKVNLGLNVTSRRSDGYHSLETLMYPVKGLNDVLEIVPARQGATTLTCYGLQVNCPAGDNLVMRACRLMQAEHGVPAVEVYLYKHIPFGAGLGGGSSDAAKAVVMLNEMFGLQLSKSQLAGIAARLGADCAFFVYNSPMLATGIGDVLEPASIDLAGKYMLLLMPGFTVSTATAYSGVKPQAWPVPIKELAQHPVSEWQGRVVNDFEPSVFAKFPRLAQIKRTLLDAGATYASMSGSGSSMYGIFENANLSELAKREFPDCQYFVIKL